MNIHKFSSEYRVWRRRGKKFVQLNSNQFFKTSLLIWLKCKSVRDEIAQEERADLTRQLDNVYSCLKTELKRSGCNHIGFYEFCLHPTDFARTVENIFYVSFLVKEARVRIVRPDSGLPQLG
ncbi:unnamed protein product [Enterobius vermicularis]|uniref:Non-structural maintenance of chromosomes element 4 n=1 Tax=Enterobius vermicularis TaxID=51028 RepID=A0A3P6HDD6_ENTVE|nr:unnamed protein product [Enterobius vermicularis]